MKIERFMENVTDNFHDVEGGDIKDRLLNSADGNIRFSAWYDFKPDVAGDAIANADVPLEQQYVLREEDFGGILLRGATGNVYRLDSSAYRAISELLQGRNVEEVARLSSSTAQDTTSFLNRCKEIGALE